MKLGEIFLSRDAWQRLSTLKMPPQTAYRLLKYAKQIMAELDILEQQRVRIVREITGTQDGQEAFIGTGTPEHARFLEKYGPVIETPSDLKPCDMSLDALVSSLSDQEGNLLSAQDLSQLEPFFQP